MFEITKKKYYNGKRERTENVKFSFHREETFMKKVIKFLPFISAILGLVALIALFLPAFTFAGKEFLGFTTVIGYTKKISGVGSFKLLSFSFMNLVTYLLALAGIVLSVLTYVKKVKLFAWIAAGCLLLAGILFFFVMPFSCVADGWTVVFGGKADKGLWKLGYGAVLAGVGSLLGAVSAAVYAFIEK